MFRKRIEVQCTESPAVIAIPLADSQTALFKLHESNELEAIMPDGEHLTHYITGVRPERFDGFGGIPMTDYLLETAEGFQLGVGNAFTFALRLGFTVECDETAADGRVFSFYDARQSNLGYTWFLDHPDYSGWENVGIGWKSPPLPDYMTPDRHALRVTISRVGLRKRPGSATA